MFGENRASFKESTDHGTGVDMNEMWNQIDSLLICMYFDIIEHDVSTLFMSFELETANVKSSCNAQNDLQTINCHSFLKVRGDVLVLELHGCQSKHIS